jgi:uncharacterized RDD family membrane protein YckC
MTAAYERTSRFLEGTRRSRREIVTPEGVPLPVELAEIGERVAAFLLDLFFWLLATAVIFLVVVLLILGGVADIGLTIGIFLAFVVRNFYFIHFELAWQGATPGKRIAGLRVIDRRGGPLLPGAVIARNLTREIEAFMPLGLLLSLGGRGGAAWEQLALGLWMLLFSALPLFNRDRLRAGDLIAGTMVIALPRRNLSRDLVQQSARFRFTERQLKAYGAFELQVLEELLRNRGRPDARELRRDVCQRICRRIGWVEPIAESDIETFLEEFYTAERAYLEREQLYGKVHADKHSQEKAAP